MRRWLFNPSGLICLIAVLASAGCTTEAPDEAAPVRGEVVRTVTRGPVEATITIRPDLVEVGEPFDLTIEVTAPTDIEVRLPDLDDVPDDESDDENDEADDADVPLLPSDDDARPRGSFEYVRGAVTPESMDGDLRVFGQTYSGATYDSGTVWLPPIEVAFTDRVSADEVIESTLLFDDLSITVGSIIGDAVAAESLREIEGELSPELKSWLARHWMLAIPFAIVVVGMLAAAVLYQRRGRLRAQLEAARPVDPEVWATTRLKRIEDERVFETAGARMFYGQLSDVLRGYVERRFGIDAPDLTTEEFLPAARDQLSTDHEALLSAFLRSADMIKFAKADASAEQAKTALDDVKRFVAQTRPVATANNEQAVGT